MQWTQGETLAGKDKEGLSPAQRTETSPPPQFRGRAGRFRVADTVTETRVTSSPGLGRGEQTLTVPSAALSTCGRVKYLLPAIGLNITPTDMMGLPPSPDVLLCKNRMQLGHLASLPQKTDSLDSLGISPRQSPVTPYSSLQERGPPSLKPRAYFSGDVVSGFHSICQGVCDQPCAKLRTTALKRIHMLPFSLYFSYS